MVYSQTGLFCVNIDALSAASTESRAVTQAISPDAKRHRRQPRHLFQMQRERRQEGNRLHPRQFQPAGREEQAACQQPRRPPKPPSAETK